MKVLYAAYRHDPLNQDLASGADFQFYQAIRNRGADVIVIGPYNYEPCGLEKVLRKLHNLLNRSMYTKFPVSIAQKVSHDLNKAVDIFHPDVVFTIFPPALAFYKRAVPTVYRQDTSFKGWQDQYPEFSHLGYFLALWIEKRAIKNADRVITHSAWNREILINNYGMKIDQVEMFPNPSAIPSQAIPDKLNFAIDKELRKPIKLLFVGREPKRKGLSIALEVLKILNKLGCDSELTICGIHKSEDEDPLIHYAGQFKKSDPSNLSNFVKLYKDAHLLLHPALFEPSSIVTSEAAAFGTPTITNDSGGQRTSVRDGISGIVLPFRSPAEAYARQIIELINDPDRYYRLCATTRERYEKELNWDVAGDRVMRLIEEVIQRSKQ